MSTLLYIYIYLYLYIARVVLIHKKGNTEDPINYRPIAVLNSEYKILTSAVTELITENLADWMIPQEQLARKNVWGTTHGLLWDKACTQAAKISRSTNYSIWYDFSKAYDSVSHVQLRRLVNSLPVHVEVRNLIKNMMIKWAVIIEVGKTKIPAIRVKRGVYQGDSMSSLLFILSTAYIINSIKTNFEITKAAKGKQQIMTYMDGIKVHAPNKKAADLITEKLKKTAADLSLALNIQKCEIFNNKEQEADNDIEDNDEEISFLPITRDHYKYL